ncbi:Penicillin-binding protein 4* [Roseovarius albus]|uniref:Penicillin-binding protein 4 n=1 Tax=Roseovarius albus TaxID=1247867 RepID=A0A1X6YNK2_9RHOB|nr:serine hydrolase domain-containing protein [Roseovarius albus]SLN25866.1 Penicillin-binding protein 4* [Roseovarius albus]
MSVQTIHSHWVNVTGHEGSSGSDTALFPYWSFTKTVIAICALKLVEQGDLDLDAPILEHPYTLRQLLQHTSGLGDYGSLPEYHQAVAAQDTPWPCFKILEMVTAKGPLFPPNKGWAYSNVGYMLARKALEQSTGKSLGAIISELISAPLGLHSVILAETRAQFSTLHWPAAASYDPRWVYHGCLIGNARDATRLLHALFQGHVLKPASLEMMLDRIDLGGPLPNRPWVTAGYALGLMSGDTGPTGRAIGHSGAGPFCVNAVYHFPDRKTPITVACFTDGSHEAPAEYEAVRIASGAI